MEDAARRQVDTALTTALGRGEIAGFVHLPHQRRGGGFDDPAVCLCQRRSLR
jgi:hypothetical protein